jgi:uncharacterized protein (TIGR03000 family)
MVSYGGMLLLSGAAIFGTPASGWAQHHGGGGHGGGGHGGGFHGGGGHGGGFHGGGFSHGFNHGGFNHGFHDGGFHHGGFHHGDFHHGFHHGGGWWYPGYYGRYGAWPYYYGYYPYSGYYGTYPYDWSNPAYDSGNYNSDGDVTSSYPDSYTPAAAQPDISAHVTVSVPADAEIWFDETKTTSTGALREYQSPPLTPGNRYSYEVRARWNDNGQEVTQTQQVKVTAGSRVNVHFPVQQTNARTAPSN